MHPFNKLMEKKMKEGAHKKMSPVERQAKMNVVHDMRKMASDSMAEPLHGLKKVTVASDSPEGLQAGLQKAQQVAGHEPDMGDDDTQMLAEGGEVDVPGEHHKTEDMGGPGDLHHASMEGLEEETGDDLDHDDEMDEPVDHVAKMDMSHAEQHNSDLSEHMTPDEIDKQIAELTKMKEMFKAKHG